jgi:hypothetical protein
VNNGNVIRRVTDKLTLGEYRPALELCHHCRGLNLLYANDPVSKQVNLRVNASVCIIDSALMNHAFVVWMMESRQRNA